MFDFLKSDTEIAIERLCEQCIALTKLSNLHLEDPALVLFGKLNELEKLIAANKWARDSVKESLHVMSLNLIASGLLQFLDIQRLLIKIDTLQRTL